MAQYSNFTDTKSFRKMRDKQAGDITIIEEGGWHFTYLGGIDSVVYKLKSFAHFNEKKFGIQDVLNKTTPEELQILLNEGKDVLGRAITYKFSDNFEALPQYLYLNRDKYSHLFHFPS